MKQKPSTLIVWTFLTTFFFIWTILVTSLVAAESSIKNLEDEFVTTGDGYKAGYVYTTGRIINLDPSTGTVRVKGQDFVIKPYPKVFGDDSKLDLSNFVKGETVMIATQEKSNLDQSMTRPFLILSDANNEYFDKVRVDMLIKDHAMLNLMGPIESLDAVTGKVSINGHNLVIKPYPKVYSDGSKLSLSDFKKGDTVILTSRGFETVVSMAKASPEVIQVEEDYQNIPDMNKDAVREAPAILENVGPIESLDLSTGTVRVKGKDYVFKSKVYPDGSKSDFSNLVKGDTVSFQTFGESNHIEGMRKSE